MIRKESSWLDGKRPASEDDKCGFVFCHFMLMMLKMLMLSCVWVCCVGILVFVIRPESSSLTPRIIITAMAIITGALVAAPQEQLAYPPTDITVSQVSLRNPKYSPAILSCVPPSGDPSFGSALVITGMYGWSQTLMPHHTMAWSSIWLSVVSLSSTPSTPSLPPTTTSSMRIIDVPSGKVQTTLESRNQK